MHGAQVTYENNEDNKKYTRCLLNKTFPDELNVMKFAIFFSFSYIRKEYISNWADSVERFQFQL